MGLDTKSLVIGVIAGYFIIPAILGAVTARRAK